jgi:hypothetical protein
MGLRHHFLEGLALNVPKLLRIAETAEKETNSVSSPFRRQTAAGSASDRAYF